MSIINRREYPLLIACFVNLFIKNDIPYSGILYNPFDFDMMDNDSESRDAFTPADLIADDRLVLILEKFDRIQDFNGKSDL